MRAVKDVHYIVCEFLVVLLRGRLLMGRRLEFRGGLFRSGSGTLYRLLLWQGFFKWYYSRLPSAFAPRDSLALID